MNSRGAGIANENVDAELRGRARILSKARALFTSEGFAAVSMQQIADAVGINKATLYHHFRDKEDLFASVMVEEFRRMSAGMSAIVAMDGSLRDQLQRVAEHILGARHTDFGRLSADLRTYVAAERRDRLMAESAAPWQAIREVVERGIASGDVRDVDPDLTARVFFAMVGSQVWWSKFHPEWSESDDALARVLTDLLLDGIGAAR
jgi:AcrR family transcriptional regulator